MKIKLHFLRVLLTLMIIFDGSFLMAQQKQGDQTRATYYSTDFESFTLGGQVACQNTINWSTWSNAACGPEDGTISNTFAQSGTKSVKVENVIDLLLLLGNRTTGKYELSWNMYIENETGGYYNIQHSETVGTDVALDIYFFQNGTGELTAGGIPTSFTYPKAAWFPVKHVIDLDLDIIQLYVNNELVSEWPFSYQSSSTTGGAKQLGAIDFFAGATGSETPRYYFDDVLFKDYEAAPVYVNDMSVQSIVKPVTGYSMTGNEIVIIKVRNNFTDPLSNIPVSYQINAGTAVNEIIPGPLAAGAVLNYSFNQFADLSVVGDYSVVATVNYPGDENAANNSLTKVVANLGSVITMQNGTFNSCDGVFYDSGSETATYQPSEDFTITILPSMPGGKINFNFTLFDTENNYDFLRVYDGIDVSAPLIGSFSGPGLPSALQNLIASDNNSSGGITFNFTSDGSVQGAGWVASVSCIAPLEHDLAATLVTGLSNPVINTPADYTVTVSNAGLMPEFGSNYVVKLFDAYDGQIGVVNGVDIGVQGTQDFTFTWTPEVDGPAFVYGKVEFTGDMNPANDRSPNFAVTVMPIGQTDITIGTGTETSNLTPVGPEYRYSFSQVLYLQSELNIANKRIFRIGYQYAGENPDLDFDIEVYLSHTTATELTVSVPLTNFTKVYDGPWVCHAGDDFSYFDIMPFYYNNTDNLIITIIEKKPDFSSSADVFKVTPTEANQHLSVAYWSPFLDPYDPNNLPAGIQMTIRPNTKLFLGDVPTNPASNTSPNTLSFGEVEMTQTDTMQVNVTNIGGGTMEITGFTSSNSNFTVVNATFPISLTMEQHHTFDVVFAPTAPAMEQGVITFLMDENIPGGKNVQLSGHGLRFGVLRESFEGELFPPLGWKLVDANNDNKGWLRNTGFVPTGQTAAHTGIAAASLDVYVGNPGEITSDDWLITPNMKWQNGDMVAFWIKRVANQDGQVWRVGYSTTGTDPGSFTIIDEITDPPMSYTEKSYDMSTFGLANGDNYFIGIQFNGEWCWPGVIDDVLGSVVNRFGNDLMVMDFKTTNDIFYANTASNFTAGIGNPGLNPVAAGAYTVNVAANVNGVETIFYTANGPAIGAGEVQTLTLPVVIPQTGLYDLYFKIIWADDLDLSNNQSDVIPVEVIPNSIVVKNIGDFPIPANASYYKYMPLNFEDYRKTSLTQSMYFVNELNTGGIIERLSYYRSFNGDMSQCKIKVWMTETPGTALDTYIAPSQQKLVFDGRVDFAAGIGRANIELSQPFVYTGSGNLVVTVYYYAGSSSSDNKYFAYKDGGYPNRTIREYGWNTIDPETPAYVGAFTEFPFTSLRFETGNGLGQISGTVLYQSDNTPVDSAQVRISNPDYPGADAIISTNAQGIYTAPYAMAGSNLKITISKYGYTDVVYNNVNLAAGGNINLGTAYMVVRPHITLNGTVIKSDTQTPAAQASITLTGMASYETTSNTDGTFVLPDIWGSTTYQIHVSLAGYQTYIADVDVPAVDFTLDPITILENAPAPNLVNAVNDQDNALITWYAVGQPYPMDFRYDDGIVNGVLITTGNPDIIGGSAWKHDALVQSVQWYTYQTENYPASTKVKLTILGLNPDASPNSSDVLYTQDSIINNYGWNTLTLPTSVAAPNGFFVGISGYDNVTLLAYDDGIGEPYEFQPNTQWSNGMGAYYPLETVTSPPLFGNIFVRATGLTTGPIALGDLPADSYSVVDMTGGVPKFICMPVTPFQAGLPNTVVNYTKADNQRSFQNYNVYRKPISSTTWQQVNTSPVTDTSFVDTGFASLTYGLYHYGVEAEYTNGVKSEMAVSNVLEKNMRITLELIVNTNTSVPGISQGAAVILTNNDGNPNYIYQGTVDATGTISIENVMKGMYSLSIKHVGFVDYQEANINLDTPDTFLQKTVILIERIDNPYDLAVLLEGQPAGTAKFVWNQPPFFDNVNSYQPFLVDNIGNWKVVDVDNSPNTYPQGVSYPHMGEANSFMTMDRSLTTPPLSEAYWGGYSGTQYFASFGSQSGVTNHWLISEEQNHTLPYTLSFYAKSITENYGLETFRIGYSVNSDNLSDFVLITGNIEASTNWTKFTYSMPAEAKYIAIRHTHTGFALLVDDITIGVETDGAIPGNGFTVLLNDEIVTTGLMTAQYTFTGLVPGNYTAGVRSNFYTGDSEIEEIDFLQPESTHIAFTVIDEGGLFVDGAEIEVQLDTVVIATAQTVNGLASFEMYPGTYSYLVSKPGYNTYTDQMIVGANPLNIEVVLYNVFSLTFIVKNIDGEPIDSANVIYKGVIKLTDSAGSTEFETISGYYSYAVTHESYNNVLGAVTINNDTTVNVVMPLISCEAPTDLAYTLNMNEVTLTWAAPEIGGNGEWLHWDGDHGNSIGTGGLVDFDVAQRFEPADLPQYNGQYLTRVMFVPSEAACTYSVRVWIGGNISQPESLVVDQLVSNPIIGQWNEIFLQIPVLIDSTKELWIGFRNNTTTGHPAGTDLGPAIDGKGNMINLAGTGWQTLLQVNPDLTYNWSVRGLIESTDRMVSASQILTDDKNRGVMNGSLSVMKCNATKGFNDPRVLLGYNVYRNDVKVNQNLIASLSYNDFNLPVGTYEYKVTSLFSNDCESDYSNSVNVEVTEMPCLTPADLSATSDTIDPNVVHLAWSLQQAVEFRYDDGIRVGNLGFTTGTLNGVVGSKHSTSAEISELSWLLSDDVEGGGPHATVQLYIFGLTSGGLPNSNDLLYTASVTNTDGIWNTHLLSETILAEGGFFMGVAYEGFVGLGTDDGLVAPWVYQPGTHYYSSDFTSGNWTAWESSGFSVNGMIRAVGMPGAVKSYTVEQGEVIESDIALIQTAEIHNTGSPEWQSLSDENRDNLLGFNIYMNDVLLDSLWQYTIYSYNEPNVGQHCYTVTAQYMDCGETEPSNVACITNVDIEKIDFSGVKIYPNPAKEIFTIEALDLKRLTIFNSVAQIVYDREQNLQQTIVINSASFSPGMYLIRLTTAGGIITRRISIIK